MEILLDLDALSIGEPAEEKGCTICILHGRATTAHGGAVEGVVKASVGKKLGGHSNRSGGGGGGGSHGCGLGRGGGRGDM
jgi:hypothetical protein